MPAVERLHTRGAALLDGRERPVVLQGVNMYLQWYRSFYASAVLDVPHLRQAVPAANCVRFVALLWHDANVPTDGLECASDDAANGYVKEVCLRYMDALVQQATDAGFWVIIAARAKYAAGWGGGQDVWNSPWLKEQMYAMWDFVARRYAHTDRIAGYEIMSEPRNKGVSQGAVRDFYAEGCRTVHAHDAAALCVVGPRPYYKLWELGDEIVLPQKEQILYTFDFFVPNHFVTVS